MAAEDRYSSLPAPLQDQSGETIGAASDCSGPASVEYYNFYFTFCKRFCPMPRLVHVGYVRIQSPPQAHQLFPDWTVPPNENRLPFLSPLLLCWVLCKMYVTVHPMQRFSSRVSLRKSNHREVNYD